MIERGFLGGAVLVAFMSWAGIDRSWPLLSTIHGIYSQLADNAAMWFFSFHW